MVAPQSLENFNLDRGNREHLNYKSAQFTVWRSGKLNSNACHCLGNALNSWKTQNYACKSNLSTIEPLLCVLRGIWALKFWYLFVMENICQFQQEKLDRLQRNCNIICMMARLASYLKNQIEMPNLGVDPNFKSDMVPF